MRDVIELKKSKSDSIQPEKDKQAKERSMKNVLLSWSALEYDYITKSSQWYWAVGILTLALVTVAVLIQSFLFAIFIVLTGFTIALYGAKRPRIIDFSLTHRGIQIAERLYLYDTLKSFWIHYDPPRKKEIDIISKKMLMPHITIPLGSTDPNKARAILVRTLKEEESQESLSEIIAKYLGF